MKPRDEEEFSGGAAGWWVVDVTDMLLRPAPAGAGENCWTGSGRNLAGNTLVMLPSAFHRISSVDGDGPAVARRITPVLVDLSVEESSTCMTIVPARVEMLIVSI